MRRWHIDPFSALRSSVLLLRYQNRILFRPYRRSSRFHPSLRRQEENCIIPTGNRRETGSIGEAIEDITGGDGERRPGDLTITDIIALIGDIITIRTMDGITTGREDGDGIGARRYGGI